MVRSRSGVPSTMGRGVGAHATGDSRCAGDAWPTAGAFVIQCIVASVHCRVAPFKHRRRLSKQVNTIYSCQFLNAQKFKMFLQLVSIESDQHKTFAVYARVDYMRPDASFETIIILLRSVRKLNLSTIIIMFHLYTVMLSFVRHWL